MVAKRFGQLACVKLLGGDEDDERDSDASSCSDDDDAPFRGLAGDSSDTRGLSRDVSAKKASRSKNLTRLSGSAKYILWLFYKLFELKVGSKKIIEEKIFLIGNLQPLFIGATPRHLRWKYASSNLFKVSCSINCFEDSRI